jgi:hypothetical protein
MLEKHDVRKNRNGRTQGTLSTPHGSASGHASRSARPTLTGNKPAVAPHGLKLGRYFTAPGDDGFAGVEWELRTAAITGENGKMVFEQRDVEVPRFWSQTATNVVVQKYFRGQLGTEARERSVRQLIDRVADTITSWGLKDGYFADAESAETYRAELKHLLVNQKMSFNSPVWFNVGIEAEPQCSACFINSVDDTMDSILRLAHTEGMLFKYGSGTGSNLSAIRSSREYLNGGGSASGPVSFMRGFDAFAGVIKSGGKTRRAAKMVILNVSHPDIEEFIWCKAKEEKKAWALIDAGYDGSFDGEAYKSVFFQNSNNSVRVTDEFMEAVQKDREFTTRAVIDGRPVQSFKARDRWRAIAQAAWECGDPGLQYDTTVNDWHTSANTARINASNPCSEYMYLDDSACNLASLNLRRFQTESGSRAGFDVEAFRHAVETTIVAQEIIVGNAKYPSAKIAENSHRFRPLGLGYANLGSLLMSMGLPYDSEPARAWCGALTSLMTGWAYRTSAVIARDVTGPFAGYPENEEPFLRVMRKHRHHVDKIDAAYVPVDLMGAARDAWDDGHHRLHDGLRHHGDRARHRAHQVQAPGRRRDDQDRQQHARRGAAAARLRRRPAQGDHRLRGSRGDDRGRPGPRRASPAGLRLRVPCGQWHAIHRVHGPHPHDGRRAAVPVGRHLEDGEPASRLHGRGRRGRLHGVVEAGPEGRGDLPRRLQAHAAAVDQQGGSGARQAPGGQRHPVHRARGADRDERRSGGRAAEAPGRAALGHAQVFRGGPRGLPARGSLRERHAG